MTDTPMTPDRLPFFQPGHLYAARMGWPEGRERFRFLCESITTDVGTGQLVAYGQHGRLRTADSQWIWTPNPRTHDDWKGGAWTDITDWAYLLAEVDRLRARVAELEEQERFQERNTLPDLHRQIEHHKDGKDRWRKRAETAEARVADLEAEREAVLALHRKHDDSDHCFADDETWPCQTRTALDSPDAGTPRLTGLPLGLTGRARHDARVAVESKAAPRDLRPGAAAARRMLRRPGACFTCGDVPDEWCPDCACCKAGCDGGRTNNPCTHPNAPWNTEPTP
ncbi:hypothetical protein [Streptomyces sp. NPDC058629]|uniref:hypothetical protein n=1 Tax=Streptomyces sp. NPDC058629 TaxID=3346565 RepID=UPI00366772E9